MYSNDLTWTQWAQLEESNWQKFYDLTYGLTDVQILLLPAFSGKTQIDLDSIRACFNIFKQLHDAYLGLNATALPVYNYDVYVVPFQY